MSWTQAAVLVAVLAAVLPPLLEGWTRNRYGYTRLGPTAPDRVQTAMVLARVAASRAERLSGTPPRTNEDAPGRTIEGGSVLEGGSVEIVAYNLFSASSPVWGWGWPAKRGEA